jgi:hypothetical protein
MYAWKLAMGFILILDKPRIVVAVARVAALTVFWKFLFQKLEEKKKKKNVKWGVAGDRA